MRKKILVVFGTRPEAIKMAPLILELRKYPEKFDPVVCVTGQHRIMLDQVLNLFNIKPDFDLDIMKSGQDLYDITSKVLLGIREVISKVDPNLILVHGDTTTSTSAALASFYQQIPVCHIEAGLRTYDKYSPWPEEINRQITSRIATYHFAPTNLNRQNLLNEGISDNHIFVTGNTVIDSLHWVVNKIKNNSELKETIIIELINLGIPKHILEKWIENDRVEFKNKTRKLVLITGHRRENFGDGFINICNAIKELALSHQDVDFVYPMHLNPNVRNAINKVFGNTKLNNVFLIEPLEYLPFVYLMNISHLILTDSGGIQEEAPSLGKPVLVMRDTTERPEALIAGTIMLVGTNKNKIIREVNILLENIESYNSMTKNNNPYGDGNACFKIVQALQ